MIGLVLVQHGKGADMGAAFGSGASGSLFGATGSANFLSRSTAVCAAVFFACTLALAFMANDRTSGRQRWWQRARRAGAGRPVQRVPRRSPVPRRSRAPHRVAAPAVPAARPSAAAAVPSK